MTPVIRGIRLVLVALVFALPACRAAPGEPGERTVHITIHFSRFFPDNVVVHPGEAVTFVVRNTDPIDHEFILGDRHVQRFYEKGTETFHTPKPGVMTVPADTTRVTTYLFPFQSGQLLFGCHVPGHYAYGMRGLVTISD